MTWTNRITYSAGVLAALAGIGAIVYFKPRPSVMVGGFGASGLLLAYSSWQLKQEVEALALTGVSAVTASLGGSTPQEKAIAIARSMLGMEESSPQIQGLIKEYATQQKWVYSPTTPWCAIWVTWVVRQVKPSVPWTASTTAIKSYAGSAQAAPGNRVGSIAYRLRPNSSGQLIGHVGLVIEEGPGDKIVTLEGNYSDRVAKVTDTIAAWDGYWKWW